uniref:Ankyrin repeat protein n=1 Tax=Colletotrichum fructicola (strain Nara gc5) TaxID=1213859 RepID=L2G4S9_COLFN
MKPISLDVAWHIFNHSEPHVQSQFTRCSRAWHSFFNPKLYRQDVTTGQYSAVFKTISNCTDTRVALATLRHACRAGADYNKPAIMFVMEAQQPSPFLVTPLYVAASKGYPDIVSFLLDHGADIDGVPDCRLRTPLFISLLSQDAETSMILLRRGARLESPEFGINALHQAAAAGLTEVMTYLIEEKGLAVDKVDSNGDTPLIHSLLSPSPETAITHLARFDVDVNRPTTIDTWRMTALSMACEDGMFSAAPSRGRRYGRVGRLAVCISARCNWTGPLLLKLIRMRRRWEAEMLLSSGVLDIDKRDSNGVTSLDWTLSTCHGNPLMASILLRRGAKTNDAVLCGLSKLWRLADARDDWSVITLLTREPKLLKIFHVVYSHCFWVASQRGDAVASRFLQDSPQMVIRLVTEMLKNGISLTKTGVLSMLRNKKEARPGPVIAAILYPERNKASRRWC